MIRASAAAPAAWRAGRVPYSGFSFNFSFLIVIRYLLSEM